MTRVVPAALGLPSGIIIEAYRFTGAGLGALLALVAELVQPGIDGLGGGQRQVGENLEDAHHGAVFGGQQAVVARQLAQSSVDSQRRGNTQGVGAGFSQTHVAQSVQEELRALLDILRAGVGQAGGQ